MQQIWFSLLFVLFHWSLLINAKAIRKGPSNETLLVGQINGPSGGAARNLNGTFLSISVFDDDKILHSSLTPVTQSSFPINYSAHLKSDPEKNLAVLAAIWSPAFVFEGDDKLSATDVDTFNFEMRTIKYVIVRGEIVHDKHENGTDLPATQVKLELIENEEKGRVIDQADFVCVSKKYPCPFEYWFDTAHIKDNVNYRLEATFANQILPVRKSTHQKHQNKVLETKPETSAAFKINPKVDTEINDYKIIVVDAQE